MLRLTKWVSFDMINRNKMRRPIIANGRGIGGEYKYEGD